MGWKAHTWNLLNLEKKSYPKQILIFCMDILNIYPSFIAVSESIKQLSICYGGLGRNKNFTEFMKFFKSKVFSYFFSDISKYFCIVSNFCFI